MISGISVACCAASTVMPPTASCLVMGLHLVREWAYGRYTGFRFYSWITGVPLIWLAFASGIGGYWIVWDDAQYFSAVQRRNCSTGCRSSANPRPATSSPPASINDRFFTLLVFIHIGLPILMLAASGPRCTASRVDYLPSRRLMQGTLLRFVLH